MHKNDQNAKTGWKFGKKIATTCHVELACNNCCTFRHENLQRNWDGPS